MARQCWGVLVRRCTSLPRCAVRAAPASVHARSRAASAGTRLLPAQLFPPLKSFFPFLVSCAVFLGLTRTAAACDACALYLASGADRPGFTLSAAHQFTRLGTLWSGDGKLGNPIDQYVDSHITQLSLGYSRSGDWHAQFTLPYISRSYRRPDHTRIENGRERGLGDATLAARYRLWQTITNRGDQFELSLLGGVEFATGNSDRLEPANHVHHHFVPSGVHEHDLALGSGSTDWLVGADAGWKNGRWSARLQVQHKLRRPGAYDYRFADETTWELAAGRTFILTHSHSLAMQALFSVDRKGLDSLAGTADDDTGANVRYLGARVTGTLARSFESDLSVELPVRIRTTGIMVVPDYRIRAAMTWRF